MKITGVVCEYNPFHNGHAKQLTAMEGTKVCLMSGNFVQRGMPALLDKYVRAKAAVLCGADLVLELPLTYAIRSAEGFADGAVEILSKLGCVDTLHFGSESGDIVNIMSTAKLLLSEDFSLRLRGELTNGVSFPRARQNALESLGGNGSVLEQPNDILAVEYCKAILRRGSSITPETIRRNGSYRDSTDRENPSASCLRETEDWKGSVPEAALEVFAGAPRHTVEAGERAWLARLRGMSEAEFAALPYGSEGLWRKLMHACRTEKNLDAILRAAKSKRYTHTRLMRMLLCAYLGLRAEDLERPAPYVRALAMNERGQRVLRRAKTDGNIQIIHAGQTPPDPYYFELERRAADLYGLLCEESPAQPDTERHGQIFRKKNEKSACILRGAVLK